MLLQVAKQKAASINWFAHKRDGGPGEQRYGEGAHIGVVLCC